MGVRWEYGGSTVGIRWEYDGSTVGVQWEYSGSTVGVQWEYCGSTVGVLWEYCGSVSTRTFAFSPLEKTNIGEITNYGIQKKTRQITLHIIYFIVSKRWKNLIENVVILPIGIAN